MLRPFRIVNVFGLPGQPFSGNQLCVVDDAEGLSTETMQAIARQTNLSESTFVTAGQDGTDATVRIFTPSVELGFAGHPTLGTASVVGERLGTTDVVLGMPVGPIPVHGEGATWTLTANPARVRDAQLVRADGARMLGLADVDVVADPRWVDSGLEQLFVQLSGAAAVERAVPDAALVRQWATSGAGEGLAYVWAWTGAGEVTARLFFSVGSALVEDPATGSAAANLGGLLAYEGRRGVRIGIDQGRAVDRPSRLVIDVDDTGSVRVSGLVYQIGQGTLALGEDGR